MSTARSDPRLVEAREGHSLGELELYWEEAHRQIARDQGATPAIVEGHPRLVNVFDDFAHRLGMRANFRRLGPLAGRRVLDLGCGRGRWAEEFTRRGAQVTGVDWSAEALAQARVRVPGATFVRMPITSLELSGQSFDVVNCVTVVQHVPYAIQATVLREAARVLAPGGMLSLLELTAAEPGPHVFPRAAGDWVGLARECGFAVVGVRGCCYELVFRPYKAVMKRLRARRDGASDAPSAVEDGVAGVGRRSGMSLRQRANRLVMASLALPAFPVEVLSLSLPAKLATHAAMIFRRSAD